jgi:hypothetical protein
VVKHTCSDFIFCSYSTTGLKVFVRAWPLLASRIAERPNLFRVTAGWQR